MKRYSLFLFCQKAQLEHILENFENISRSQENYLSRNQKIWESKAVNYFKHSNLEREMGNHFNDQNSQILGLKNEVEVFGQRLTKLSMVMESLIKHEFYKKKYLESESNLSKFLVIIRT